MLRLRRQPARAASRPGARADGRRGRRRAARVDLGRRHPLLGRAGTDRRDGRHRRGDPARRPRAVPLLHAAGGALRRGGPPGDRLYYFGRTAGLGPRGEDFDHWPEVRQTTPEQIQADAAAALHALREREQIGAAVTVGFCFGGMHSFLAGIPGGLDVLGVVGFYGALDGARMGIEGPLQRAAQIAKPLLGLFGEADQGIPVEQVREFERRLRDAGAQADIVIYPGAPHSFFDRRQEEHAQASSDAWRRVLDFLGRVAAPVR